MHTIVIESDQAFARIQQLAEREGKSVATVVVEAIEEKLDRQVIAPPSSGLAERLINIGRQTAPRWLDDTPHGDLLYDEDGIPR